ncbi:hypothetical protein [Gordonia neofelifaecis]|uniref:Uncharacterized protein n=1 Tax=Gordonia neofelifaecis NRRL B-59395 TaxID=644548 RepID=F1YKR9_9ACTN|nr:hypothetical protein [Gordonia neofelifaecis]EGD54713.1 hypothetical protein SCNU_12512 [Gordonia neofelifaecis NRRL B-59395]
MNNILADAEIWGIRTNRGNSSTTVAFPDFIGDEPSTLIACHFPVALAASRRRSRLVFDPCSPADGFGRYVPDASWRYCW